MAAPNSRPELDTRTRRLRPVTGLDRPAVQWLFIALAVVLILLCAALTLALWRARAGNESLRAASVQARVDREALEARLARETAARESLTLELARQKGGAREVGAPPTLTLEPVRAPGALPPPATVDAPGAALVVELRLLLPADRSIPAGPYAVSVRDWSTGELYWTRGGVRQSDVAGRRAVVSLVNGDVLRRGSFEITVTANEAGGARAEVAIYEVTVR